MPEANAIGQGRRTCPSARSRVTTRLVRLRWGNTQLPLLKSYSYHITYGMFCQGVCKRGCTSDGELYQAQMRGDFSQLFTIWLQRIRPLPGRYHRTLFAQPGVANRLSHVNL